MVTTLIAIAAVIAVLATIEAAIATIDSVRCTQHTPLDTMMEDA